jgi:pantetheine-phosphate adenylyltransferase
MKIAVFPGSFDPVTKGHESIVRRALPLFDEIIIGIGNNTEKKYFFSIKKRESFIKKVFEKEPKIKVKRYDGLTIEFCKSQRAGYILRGLRTSADFEFERAIAQMNHAMAPEVETVFIVSDPSLSHVSSTIVRDILLNRGEVSLFVPEVLKGMMTNK